MYKKKHFSFFLKPAYETRGHINFRWSAGEQMHQHVPPSVMARKSLHVQLTHTLTPLQVHKMSTARKISFANIIKDSLI